MKKKVFGIMAAVMLMISFSMTVVAETGDGTVTKNGDKVTIPGTGNIEMGDIPADLIQVTISSEFDWYVTAASYPEVKSSDFKIKNDSSKLVLSVKLTEFEQTNTPGIPSEDLRLELTGDLAEGDLTKDIVGTAGVAYSQNLMPNAVWTYGFTGEYNGKILAEALQPEYEMLLEFGIVEVNSAAAPNN